MKIKLLLILLLNCIISVAQEREKHDSSGVSITNWQYTICHNGKEWKDSLLFNPDKYFLLFPNKSILNYDDTMEFIYVSDLYRKLHQPILYNKNTNYFLAVDSWRDYMVTAIISGNGKISLSYINGKDSSTNVVLLNKALSKSIIRKIENVTNMSVSPYGGDEFIGFPIIVEYKYNGKSNTLPIVSLKTSEPYIKSYQLMRKLHRIAVRKQK